MFITTAKAVELDSKHRDPKYVENIVARSQKTVDKLELKDTEVVRNVTNIVAAQNEKEAACTARILLLQPIYHLSAREYDLVKERQAWYARN